MPILSLSLLGPFVALVEGTPLTNFRTKSVQALLVYLAIESQVGGAIRRAFLAEMLYPGLSPTSSKKNLRQTLYELRKLLAAQVTADPPLLLSDRQSVQLNKDWTIDSDLTGFEVGVKSDELEQLEETAGLYRGDFLSDFYLPDSSAFEAWAAERRAYYRRLALGLFDKLAGITLASGAYGRAETYARRQLVLDDLNEGASRQLMAALAAQSRRSAALAEFNERQRRLAEELDVEPAAETLALFQRIQAGETGFLDQPLPDSAESVNAKAPVEGPEPLDGTAPNNLPPQPTHFVGREEELAEINKLLAGGSSTRLMTLLGPGGSGKSRLALEAAGRFVRENSADFPDGIWYVPLAALSDSESVVAEVARNIKMVFAGDDVPRSQQLVEYLAQKKLLLILDNYEQLLADERLPLPAEILSYTAQVNIVVTSRARLNIRGEHLLTVNGLALPKVENSFNPDEFANFSAIALFIQSAGRVNADFIINEANWSDIVRISHLVQGLPLGIELAATWMEVITPAEIAAEIERSLDFLAAEWSDIPDRQRSMRAVFDASWRLLSSEEQYALQRLSTFRGPFSRPAAAAVAAADLKMLLVLVNKSWLHRDAAGDYQLHELLRQYCQEKLNIDQTEYFSARMDHAYYFAAWVEGMGQAIRGHGQKEALSAIAGAFENIRLAWAWLVVEGEVSALTRQMLPALVRFCAARTRGEDMLALVGAAQGAIKGGELNTADALILETARLAFANGFYAPPYFGSLNLGSFMPAEGSERVWLAFKKIDPRQVDALWPVLTCLIYAWISRQDRPTTDRLRELIQIYQDEGKDWSLAFALKNLGQIESSPSAFYSDESLAKDIATKSLGIRRQETALVLKKAAAIFRRVGDQLELADSLRLLGIHHHFLEPQLALKPLLQAKRLFKEMGDLVMAAEISSTLAIRSIWLGDIEEGFAHYKEKRDIFEALGNRRYLAHAADNEALHALRHFGIDHARQLRHQSRKLFTELGLDSYLAWNLWEIGDLERVAGNLDLALDYYQRAHHLIEREDMPFARIFYARGMGDHAQAKGDSQAALNFFSESLHLSRELGHRWAAGYALCGLGRAYMGAGRLDKASRYFYQAVHQTQRIGQNDLTMIALVGLAKLKSVSGRPEQSIILATFVSHHRQTWLETKGQAKEIITDAAGHLPEETANAARQRGLTMTKEEILAMVYAEEGSEEE